MATRSIAKRWKRLTAATVLLSAAAIGLVATPAVAATVSWNYSAPNCTQTTITGQNWNAAPWFRGSTSRSQDICLPGTSNITRLTLFYGGASAVWSTTGTNTGTGQISGSGTKASYHEYAASGRLIYN